MCEKGSGFDWLLYKIENCANFTTHDTWPFIAGDDFPFTHKAARPRETSSQGPGAGSPNSPADARGPKGKMGRSDSDRSIDPWLASEQALEKQGAHGSIPTCVCHWSPNRENSEQRLVVVGYGDGMITAGDAEGSKIYCIGSINQESRISSGKRYPTCMWPGEGPSVFIGTNTGEILVWSLVPASGKFTSKVRSYGKVQGSLKSVFVVADGSTVFLVTKDKVYAGEGGTMLSSVKVVAEFGTIFHCFLLNNERIVVVGAEYAQRESTGFLSCFIPSFLSKAMPRGPQEQEQKDKLVVKQFIVTFSKSSGKYTNVEIKEEASPFVRDDWSIGDVMFAGKLSDREIWIYHKKLYGLYFPPNKQVIVRELQINFRFENVVGCVNVQTGAIGLMLKSGEYAQICKTVPDTISASSIEAFCANVSSAGEKNSEVWNVFCDSMIFLRDFVDPSETEKIPSDRMTEILKQVILCAAKNSEFVCYFQKFIDMYVDWCDYLPDDFSLTELCDECGDSLRSQLADNAVTIVVNAWERCREEKKLENVVDLLTKYTGPSTGADKVLREQVTDRICTRLGQVGAKVLLPDNFVRFFGNIGYDDVKICLEAMKGEFTGVETIHLMFAERYASTKEESARQCEFTRNLELYQLGELKVQFKSPETDFAITYAFDRFDYGKLPGDFESKLVMTLGGSSSDSIKSLIQKKIMEQKQGSIEMYLILARLIDPPFLREGSDFRKLIANSEEIREDDPINIPIQAAFSDKPPDPQKWEALAKHIVDKAPLFSFPLSLQNCELLVRSGGPANEEESFEDMVMGIIDATGPAPPTTLGKFLNWSNMSTDDPQPTQFDKIYQKWKDMSDDEKTNACKELAISLLMLDFLWPHSQPQNRERPNFREFMLAKARENADFLKDVWGITYASGSKTDILCQILGEELWRKNIWYFLHNIAMPSGQNFIQTEPNVRTLYLECFILDKAEEETDATERITRIDDAVLEFLKANPSQPNESGTEATGLSLVDIQNSGTEYKTCAKFGLLKSMLYTLRNSHPNYRIQVVGEPLKDCLEKMTKAYENQNLIEGERYEKRAREILELAATLLKGFKSRREERYMWGLGKVILDKFESKMRWTGFPGDGADPIETLFLSFAVMMLDIMPREMVAKQIVDRLEKWTYSGKLNGEEQEKMATEKSEARMKAIIGFLKHYLFNLSSTATLVLDLVSGQESRRNRQSVRATSRAWCLGPQCLCTKCNGRLDMQSGYIRTWTCGHMFHDNGQCVQRGIKHCPVCYPSLPDVVRGVRREEQDPVGAFYQEKLRPLAKANRLIFDQLVSPYAIMNVVMSNDSTEERTTLYPDVGKWFPAGAASPTIGRGTEVVADVENQMNIA